MAVRRRGKFWFVDYYSPDGKRVRRSFKLKREARDENAKIISLKGEGRYLDIKPECKTTLKQLCERYEQNFSQQRSWQNKGRYLLNFQQFFGADTLLDKIKFVDLETYWNTLKQKPVGEGIRSAAAVNREMACLKHLMNKAVEWQLLERSPFAQGQKLAIREQNIRLRFLTADEITTLLDACEPRLKPIVTTAILTGMRRSEITSLKWSQVRADFIYLTKTKTGYSRQIPVSKALAAVLAGIEKVSEFVFEQFDVKHAFTQAVKRAGLVDVVFYTLRHTTASQILLRGGNLAEIKEILGHKSIQTTMRYSHLSAESKRKAINLLNDLV